MSLHFFTQCHDNRFVDVITASGLLGSQIQNVFRIDGWQSIGTGLTRASPPEIVKLDILDAAEIEKVLDEVKYAIFKTWTIVTLLTEN